MVRQLCCRRSAGTRGAARESRAAGYDQRVLSRRANPIVAIATAPGRGAVGIVRLSGPDLQPLVQALCARTPAPRQATLLPLCAADGSLIDQGLVLYFPSPHSYTGEDVLELQVHGGPVLLQMLLARCLEAGQPSGLRVAEPGEFTKRALAVFRETIARPESERSAFLDAACGGDAALRAKVETMLQFDRDGDDETAAHPMRAVLSDLAAQTELGREVRVRRAVARVGRHADETEAEGQRQRPVDGLVDGALEVYCQNMGSWNW